MKIQWKFADKSTSEVEVSEEIGIYITTSRREESNLERKERYHCYSLDAIDFEGMDYADEDTTVSLFETKQENYHLYVALSMLTEVQRRRLLMLADGLTVREIARIEGVAHNKVMKSIELARKKLKKLL